MTPKPENRRGKPSATYSESIKNKAKTSHNNNNTIHSSFPGIIRYSGERGKLHPNVFDWLEAKRRDDDIGNYWRVHDKLYNLEEFISKHPGGTDWIEFSRGTDITEAFESHHLINLPKVESTLAKYYVKDATTPRNSPYTFKDDGFYRTLKRKVEPILKKIGMEPSDQAIRYEDSLFALYIVLVIFGVTWDSTKLQIAAGVVLGMVIVGGHNFFHKKDTWRRFYFDLSGLSSYEWRISHGFSHHLYPNTILDFEVLLGEPLVEMLPVRPKRFVHKYIMPFVIDMLYGLFGVTPVIMRIISIAQGKQKLRPENLLVLVKLGIFMFLAPSAWSGFMAWVVILTSSFFWAGFVSNNASHHHPDCFHDGDEARRNPDFGLCQLDATALKTDKFHQNFFSVLTTFGEHPLHHLFPTVCHGKLKYLKPAVEETLKEFSEEVLGFTQWELFVGTHQQLRRSTTHKHRQKP